jgi:hypothetical protein
MKCRVASVYFPAGERGRYDMNRLLQVYLASAKVHGVPVEVFQQETPSRGPRHASLYDNTDKLDTWVKLAMETTIPLVLTDADMMFQAGEFEDAFAEEDFDIGITFRTGDRKFLPLNGGVIFVRPTFAARLFMSRWQAVNLKMLKDAKFHQEWATKYAGMNQSALGYLLEKEQPVCKIKKFPCRVWNAVDEDWSPKVSGEAKLVHIKSKLRSACLRGSITGISPAYRHLVRKWRSYEAISLGR